MIVYAADRSMNILGVATTENRRGLIVGNDSKIEDVETGVSSFEMTAYYTKQTRATAESMFEVGNYLLRKDGSDEGMFTIIETESDPEEGTISVYAEDAGLDLLNDVCPAYAADTDNGIVQYVEDCIDGTGFEIGVNTYGTDVMTLKFDEQTAKERLDDIAAKFDAEINFSFKVDGMTVTNMFVNIYRKRGNDTGAQLLLNRDVANIRVTKNIDKLATGLIVVGGTEENSDIPVNLEGYEYDDGDFYVSGRNLYSRQALRRWARFLPHEKKQAEGVSAHVMRVFHFDTVSQEQLCQEAIKELTALRDPAVNYEIDIVRLPENAGIGDTLYIIDREGELYLQGRILKLETRCSERKKIATLGIFLIKRDVIAESIDNLTQQIKDQKKELEKEINNSKVVRVVIEHCLATNRVIPPGSTFSDIQYTPWSEQLPEYIPGRFYWARIVTYYADGTVEYGDPYFDMGAQVTAETVVAVQEAQDAADTAEDIAEAARTAAGQRRRVFNSTPAPPYDLNDLWFDGPHGTVFLCTNAKAEGQSYALSDWTSYATDVSNHFWYDQSGAHVAEVPGDVTTGASQTIASNGTVMMRNGKVITSWTGTDKNSAAINFYDLNSSVARASDLIASYGKEGITHYINNIVCQALTASGLSFYTPDEYNYPEAIFGSAGVILYALGKAAMQLNSGSMKFYDTNGITEIAEFGSQSAQIGKNGTRHTTIDTDGMRVYSDGTNLIANLGYGYGEDASGASVLAPFFTLGKRSSSVVGNYSMVEGYNNSVEGFCGHAEGNGTSVTAPYGHAEGKDTQVTANSAHAGGIGNVANQEAMTVIGKYATVPTTDDLVLIGNGSSASNRHNAVRLRNDGHVEFDGPVGSRLYFGSTALMKTFMNPLSLYKPYLFSAGPTWVTSAGAVGDRAFGVIFMLSTTSYHLFFQSVGSGDHFYKCVFDANTDTYSTTQLDPAASSTQATNTQTT